MLTGYRKYTGNTLAIIPKIKYTVLNGTKGIPRLTTTKSLCAREIISAVYGEAETRPPLAAGKGVMLMINNKLPHTLGAELTARGVPEACEPG